MREHVQHLKSVEAQLQVMPTGIESCVRLDSEQSTADFFHFAIDPITYRVRERVKNTKPNLFVVVEGYLRVSRTMYDGRLMTTGFGTHVAYFRYKEVEAKLTHDLGVHYDFDSESISHPAFHSQFKTFLKLHTEVSKSYRLDLVVEDNMSTALRGVRIPSAQMDVFSVILQICADHALGEDSGEEKLVAFNKMRECCRVLTGAAHSLERFEPLDPSCYRAPHWYAPA